MFTETTGIMLYVDDVIAEKEFWAAIGFSIQNETEMMGYESFEMKPHKDSSTVFTVYDKEFIKQVSPQVIDHVPSVLFEAKEIENLQERVAGLTDTAGDVQTDPFPNFNFASPSGIYFAVRGV